MSCHHKFLQKFKMAPMSCLKMLCIFIIHSLPQVLGTTYSKPQKWNIEGLNWWIWSVARLLGCGNCDLEFSSGGFMCCKIFANFKVNAAEAVMLLKLVYFLPDSRCRKALFLLMLTRWNIWHKLIVMQFNSECDPGAPTWVIWDAWACNNQSVPQDGTVSSRRLAVQWWCS